MRRAVCLAALLCALGILAGSARGAELPDGRAWEMVSPVAKNGGGVAAPGGLFGGGVLQASADGQAVTYGSAASFGPGALGAPGASQYISRRGPAGWSLEDLTTPTVAGAYGSPRDGVPYQLFSGDLARGLLLNGRPCGGEAQACPVANPPLPGTGAPVGYQDYYLRDQARGAFGSLLTAADLDHTALGPAEFSLALLGASPDLTGVVLSSCAALTADAVEVPAAGGCDPAARNLYLWSGGGLALLNVLPGEAQGTPGAELAAPAGAVSAAGARVYWVDAAGGLYLAEGGASRALDLSGTAEFQAASDDGSRAYFLEAGHLYRWLAAGGAPADLTPAGGVKGVLGVSADGGSVYYQDAGGLRLWHEGTTTTIVAGADAAAPSDYPPATGTARVGADGAQLAFLSSERLQGYDNTDRATGLPDPEVFLYDADSGGLACASCRPSGTRPTGPSTIPGAIPNGTGPLSVRAYKPRVLSADGRRIFFDSRDALLPTDTNDDADVYEWERGGEGGCTRFPGCLALISSGRSADGAGFADASADGDDAFFLTGESLLGADPGSVDLYDARVGGGFPEAAAPIPCEGNACQALPPEPTDPALDTLLEGLGNPKVRYLGGSRRCRHARRHKAHKGRACRPKAKAHRHRRRRGHHRHHHRGQGRR